MRRAQRTLLARAIVIGIAAVAASSCASLPPESIQPEKGYYYGIGSGPSAAEAVDAARRDLVSNALTASRDGGVARGARVEISAEAARAVQLPRLRPYAQKKTADSVSIAYRLKTADWDKVETKREAAVRSEVVPQVAGLARADRPLAERMLEAARLLERLRLAGLTGILTETGPGSPLVSVSIESICRDQTSGMAFSMDPEHGFVGRDSAFSLRGTTPDGKPLASLPIRAEWTARDIEPLAVLTTTGPDGKAYLYYPSLEAFRNRAVRLKVSTNFAQAAPSSGALKEIDARSAVEYRYHHFDDAAAYFSAGARVPGGPFTAGALPRDKRASRKEAPRAATTAEIVVDRYPVTNAMYAMFLDDTGATSYPEYWDNPQYNRDDQPVVGVSWADANRFAAWLSQRLGVVKRLPTEDEWEKAARGGRDVIYPWGDQSPSDGPRANFDGNGRFAGPSPVGSYESGVNAYGLADMAGNVWQWTATSYGPTQGSAAGEATGSIIVKGGSWMDGPNDLRISNRRDVDPSKGYADIGFRLVREVSNE